MIIMPTTPCFLGGSSLNFVNLKLWRNGDVIIALCLVHNTITVSDCSIQYTQDPSYVNLSPPVTGPINTPFSIVSINEASILTSLYFQVMLTINSSLEVVIRESSTVVVERRTTQREQVVSTEIAKSESMVVLKVYQICLLGIFILFLVIALTVCSGIVYFLCRKGKPKKSFCKIFL